MRRRTEEKIMALISIGVITSFVIGSAGYQESKERKLMSTEVGFKIGSVKTIELINNEEQYQAVVTCKEHKTKDVVNVYYNITPIDYVVMSGQGCDVWHYFETKIAPFSDPAKIERESIKTGTVDTTKKHSSDSMVKYSDNTTQNTDTTPIMLTTGFSYNVDLEDDFIH